MRARNNEREVEEVREGQIVAERSREEHRKEKRKREEDQDWALLILGDDLYLSFFIFVYFIVLTKKDTET